MKLVSAIIITHNRRELLKRAIESVLSQTYSNIECIVVDDASSDGTYELFSNREDIEYIYIPSSESHGGNYARNLGITTAKGEYVAFLDDDDYWLPSKIEKQVNLIEEKQCGAVYCGMRPEFVEIDGCIRYENWPPLIDGQGDISKKILTKIYIITSGLLVQKSLIEEVGKFDESLRYWQEYDLSIRLAQKTQIYAVEDCLYVYRINKYDTQRLTNKFDLWIKNAKYIHFKYRNLYEQLPLYARIDSLRLYHGEAANRARNAGLNGIYIYHKMICIILKRVRLIID